MTGDQVYKGKRKHTNLGSMPTKTDSRKRTKSICVHEKTGMEKMKRIQKVKITRGQNVNSKQISYWGAEEERGTGKMREGVDCTWA